MTVPKHYLMVIFTLIIFCIVCYWIIFESTIYDNILSEYKIDHLPTIQFIRNNKNESTQDKIPKYVVYELSHSLNFKLYNLSSIQRTSIKSSDWINPSIITNTTIIIGYCCETQHNFDCILPKFVLILSMAIWIKPTQNIYFQKCHRNGLPPSHLQNNIITIKQRRNYKLNNNGTKQWILHNNNKLWFQPDIYLCQGYFYDDKIIETRSNTTETIQLMHEESIDFLNLYISSGRNTNFPSHKLETYRPFLVTMNTEFWGGGRCSRYDIVFDTVIGRSTNGCFTIHTPPAFWYEFMRINNKTQQLILPKSEIGKQKYLKHIINIKNRNIFHTMFLVKYCYVDKRYNADVIVRVLFFDMLQQKYKESKEENVSIDSLGKCRKNQGAIKKMGINFIQRGRDQTFGYQGVRDGATEMALKYKFMICMENTRTKGYMTEKFFNALYGYTIPIYFGDDMINTYFN
eukprot:297603_1